MVDWVCVALPRHRPKFYWWDCPLPTVWPADNNQFVCAGMTTTPGRTITLPPINKPTHHSKHTNYEPCKRNNWMSMLEMHYYRSCWQSEWPSPSNESCKYIVLMICHYSHRVTPGAVFYCHRPSHMIPISGSPQWISCAPAAFLRTSRDFSGVFSGIVL